MRSKKQGLNNRRTRRLSPSGFGAWSALLTGLALGLAVLAFSMIASKQRATPAQNQESRRPTLVLWITIDALRSDMVSRLADRFPEGGFRYLMDTGIWYKNAMFRGFPTLTAVGHAALFTGGTASTHGIVGNDWIDGDTCARVYCLEDDEHYILGESLRPHVGVSPKNLMSSTFGDELILASGSGSRVFSVSGKDRGAIIPAGHLGKAFWYSSVSGNFVSSSYYYREYPPWVESWHRRTRADRYAGVDWTLVQNLSGYIYSEEDDRPEEKSFGDLGRTFPHRLGEGDDKSLYASLPYTPFIDEFTLDFGLDVLRQEHLGLGPETDMLALSFSSMDYIGHAFGPDSLEYEDGLLRADRILKRLIEAADRQVGPGRTLVVLAADHGMDVIPEFRLRRGFHGGRHRPEGWISGLNSSLKARFETDRDLIIAFWNPCLYFDLKAVAAAGLKQEEVEWFVAEELMKLPGIAWAVPRSDFIRGKVPLTPLGQKLLLAFYLKRSGQVLIIQEPYWYLYHDAEAYAAMHGSPYVYDSHVPLMISGPGIPPAVVTKAVHPEDLAPTLSMYFGISAPAASSGNTLPSFID